MLFLEWDVVEAGGEVGQSYGQVGLQEGIRDWLKSRSTSRRTIGPVQGVDEKSLGVGRFGYTMFVLSWAVSGLCFLISPVTCRTT